MNLSAASPQKILCRNCGALLQEGVKFCTQCGTPAEAVTPSTQMSANGWSETTVLGGNSQGMMHMENPYVAPENDDSEGTMILESSQASVGGSASQETTLLGNSTGYGASQETTFLENAQLGNGTGYNASQETTFLENAQLGNGTGYNVSQEPMNGYPQPGFGGDLEGTQILGSQPSSPDMGTAQTAVLDEFQRNIEVGGYNHDSVPPIPPMPPVPPVPPRQEPNKKDNKTTFILVGVGVVVAAVAVVAFLVWKGIIPFPLGEKPAVTADSDITPSTTTEPHSEPDIDVEAQLLPIDELVEAGKEKIEKDEELLEGIENLRSAMDQYREQATVLGDTQAVAERIEDAYISYVDAVIRRRDFFSGQGLSGSIYAQVVSEFDQVVAYADELSNEGYTVDTSLLLSERESFVADYRSRMIKTFDEFTYRENWSRTEAWNLMSEADNMYDSADLDDPIRLRYCYALAWWIQKQTETELSAGTITSKGAAQKIAGMIEATDYNPMLIYYYIYFTYDAGEECTEVEDAYSEMIDHLGQTQGLWIGDEIDILHFWYFNDFGENSVDERNGVTPENRQWIRDRMSSVTF